MAQGPAAAQQQPGASSIRPSMRTIAALRSNNNHCKSCLVIVVSSCIVGRSRRVNTIAAVSGTEQIVWIVDREPKRLCCDLGDLCGCSVGIFVISRDLVKVLSRDFVEYCVERHCLVEVVQVLLVMHVIDVSVSCLPVEMQFDERRQEGIDV